MSELVCPRTNQVCERAEYCEVANEPLVSVIPRIRREVNGARWDDVKSRLRASIEGKANIFPVELPIAYDRDGTFIVCPSEILDIEINGTYRPDLAAAGAKNILEQAVTDVIADWPKSD